MNIDTHQIRLLRRWSSRIIFGIILASGYLCAGAATIPEEITSLSLSTIDYVYKEDLGKATEEAKKIIRKYPENPAGYFFMAVVLDSWMQLHQSDLKENEFYQYCDLTIEKGENSLAKDPKDEWAKFFIGGADGYKGTYEARYERWITAFRYGWKGVSVLLELQSKGSGLVDINYGIGNYDYWRSAMMKILWWMPGIDDKREEGIKRILITMDKGIYTKVASSLSLIDIMMNEKRFNEALAISEKMLKIYPQSSFFLWGKVDALIALKRYKEAVEILLIIKKKLDNDPKDNEYNGVVCHYWLAKAYYSQGMYSDAIVQCDEMNSYKLTPDIRKRLDKFFSDAASIRKKSVK
jgi:tetratricopeptide (TPR) repeat protein